MESNIEVGTNPGAISRAMTLAKGEDRVSLLLVDDDPCNLTFYGRLLEAHGFHVTTATSLKGLRELVGRQRFDVYLLDLYLEDGCGLDVLPSLLKIKPFSPVFILTGNSSIKHAVDAIRMGASGYLLKSDDPRSIAEEIKSKIAHWLAKVEVSDAKRTEFKLVGRSRAIGRVVEQVVRMKDADSTVLITGESGTGKEVVARALHFSSGRCDQPFVAVNAGAIPEHLLESELFGYRKGAFTDAKSDRKGMFEHCRNGTLLLDEIGELPLLLQAKLLRVLQEREVFPIGSHAPIKVNTRVIAATNRNLEEEVRAGRFRQDLYYRLSVLYIHIPPLRERKEDIPELAAHFVEVFNARYEKEIAPLSEQVVEHLKAYDWPGNIRELQNSIERAVVLSVDGKISISDVFPSRAFQTRPVHTNSQPESNPYDRYFEASNPMPLAEARQDFERGYLVRLLRHTRGNVAEAARISGQYRANLYRLINRYGVSQDEFRQ